MPDLVLGLSLYHDSSAALVSLEGDILACMTEERFSNIKHDGGFPSACIREILALADRRQWGCIRYVAFNYAPILILEEKLFSWLDIFLPAEAATVLKAAIREVVPHATVCRPMMYPYTYLEAICERLGIEEDAKEETMRRIRWNLNRYFQLVDVEDYLIRRFPDAEVVGVRHHDCHAASAFYPSGFDRAAILTIDGHGEFETVSLAEGSVQGIRRLENTVWPHSLGLLYRNFTEFLGFGWLGDEYKVMGMSAYGTPRYADLFSRLGKVDHNGVLHLTLDDLLIRQEMPYCLGEFWPGISRKFKRLLGGARVSGAPFEQRHFDIAASLQRFVEEIGIQLAQNLRARLPSEVDALCISGGVGLNGLMNQRIYQQAGFSRIFVQPASGDDGTALGAALHIAAEKGHCKPGRRLEHVFLGPDYGRDELLASMRALGLTWEEPENIALAVANHLAAGKVVARFEGRSEFGPRALGHRSIMASPLHADMKDILNARIKHREMFRPFAPACLAETVNEYFDVAERAEFMLLICPVKSDKRDLIPAVVHVDGTARVQSVRQDANPGMYAIIKEFQVLTGVPVVINTSFNVNGETIVETPQDALECFLYTDIDYLEIEGLLISKTANITRAIKLPAEQFLQRRKDRYTQRYWSHELYKRLDTYIPGHLETDWEDERVRQDDDAAHRMVVAALNRGWHDVCVAGAGVIGHAVLTYAHRHGLTVGLFSDAGASPGQSINGVPVLSLSQALDAGARRFIIAANQFEDDIFAAIMTQAAERGVLVETIGMLDVML